MSIQTYALIHTYKNIKASNLIRKSMSDNLTIGVLLESYHTANMSKLNNIIVQRLFNSNIDYLYCS